MYNARSAGTIGFSIDPTGFTGSAIGPKGFGGTTIGPTGLVSWNEAV